MSSPEQIRKQIDDVVKKRADEEKKAAEAQRRASEKGAAAASFRLRAAKATSDSMVRSYQRQAESAEKEAHAHEAKAADHAKRRAGHSAKEAALSRDLTAAMTKERADEDRARKRREADDQQARRRAEEAERRAREQEKRARDRERQAERTRTASLVFASEARLSEQIAAVRPPLVEVLRILYVTAESQGNLRVDQEIRRVKRGVKAATHRDLVKIEHLSAATPGDLLDGMSGFMPHVVHFSGHANDEVLVFDTDAARRNPGQRVRSDLFVRALMTDKPPLLVVLNACHSTGHLDGVLGVVPVAIGMSDKIHDPDAMSFATRLYTSIADGQSVLSAYNAARLQMELDGMPDADLPVLRAQEGVDPADVTLVVPPPA